MFWQGALRRILDGPHLCSLPVLQQPSCFSASTGPLRRRWGGCEGGGGGGGGRRGGGGAAAAAAAYRPPLMCCDYTCGGEHTRVLADGIRKVVLCVVRSGGGGSQPGAGPDWLPGGCPWRRHMDEEGRAGFAAHCVEKQPARRRDGGGKSTVLSSGRSDIGGGGVGHLIALSGGVTWGLKLERGPAQTPGWSFGPASSRCVSAAAAAASGCASAVMVTVPSDVTSSP